MIDVDRRLRFAFTSAAREAWIPGSFVLSRLDRLGAVGPVPAPKAAPVEPAEDDAEPELGSGSWPRWGGGWGWTARSSPTSSPRPACATSA